ncbi:MAG: hypothetical protein IIX09_05385, partial [Clostridia bacterium]|nr:hypothetical protein [Clostridia bacterium]
IEVSTDRVNYVTVVDMTETEYPGGRNYNWDFETVENAKYIRLVFTGIWNDTSDWVTLSEMFIFGNKK